MASTHTANRSFVRAVMKAPYLERDEEHRLAVGWKERQDQEALNALAVAHMRLVISIAARFKNFGLSMSDLIESGITEDHFSEWRDMMREHRAQQGFRYLEAR